MSVYLIVNSNVKDMDAIKEYREKVPELVKKHGGEYLVRGGEFEVLEGDWQPTRIVMFRFPDRDSVHALFNDPEYLPMKALRQKHADTQIVMVDGL
ncbi:MAG: DUF1330 domain-containing protein [Gammaproteobacteria bacterium]